MIQEISRNKDNQTMKLDQLLEHIVRNVSLELVLCPFLKNQN